MTEAEWLASNDPEVMFEFLPRHWESDEMLEIRKGKSIIRKRPVFVIDRKVRLFAVACFACYSQLLVDERSRRAIAVVEQVADRLLSMGDILKQQPAASAAVAAIAERGECGPIHAAAVAASEILALDATSAAIRTAHGLGVVQELLGGQSSEEWQRQASILRDIVGPFPFRKIASQREWLTPTVLSLAQAIYAERVFDRLPILADALEDAGCTDRDILDHCRQPGEHVRGCWVVDLVLEKQ